MIDPTEIPAARERARMARAIFSAALLVLGLLAAAWHWSGCATTPVRRQAQAADVVARAFNHVGRPALVAAFEETCRGEIVNACPAPPCERAVMVAALAACDARWQPVFAAYEAAAEAHGAWRGALLTCQAAGDAGGCDVDLAAIATRALAAIGGYRCAVRALGRADLDPVPGEPACGGNDAGR